ncbi:hypothetical protein MHBO_000573 [Bonamia ostreae]|uniref:Nuclear transcription factor Y subunit n=1 Tax=Bonamia ostreae TaxID=126728 RepID=A0ABV2AG47_9EUKA
MTDFNTILIEDEKEVKIDEFNPIDFLFEQTKPENAEGTKDLSAKSVAVNPKQYRRILLRRQWRDKFYKRRKIIKQSRRKENALNRSRDKTGMFLQKKSGPVEIDQLLLDTKNSEQ